MKEFDNRVATLLKELANVSGGVQSVTGPQTSGDGGGRFGVQDDIAYNPGDARLAVPLGTVYATGKRTKHKKNKKKNGIPIQRRNSVYLPS